MFRSCLRVCTLAAPLKRVRYSDNYSPFYKFLASTSVRNSFTPIYRLCSRQPPYDFEKACNETLESLTEYFEHIVEESDNLKSADVAYSVRNQDFL